MILPLSAHLPTPSRLALGCMGFGGGWDDSPVTEQHVGEAHAALEAAISVGITLLDHADIYTRGKAERTFGEIFRRAPSIRDGLLIQTKCGIRFADSTAPGRYDLSRDYILGAVDASLSRLGTDWIDVLLLHRPDPLMEPEQIAEAFDRLRSSGKVAHFGVSNMQANQMRWLQRALSAPLIVNQLEMNLLKLDWLDGDSCFNDPAVAGSLPWAGTVQYCQEQGVQLQAWSPLAKGWLSGALPATAAPAITTTSQVVEELATQYDVGPEAVVLAWLMRHPAGIQPVIGTTRPERIRACAAATRVPLTREQWYRLYVTARGAMLP